MSRSVQMDYAVPASKIATLSSGEFVGQLADSPGVKIPQKLLHAELQNDHQGIAREESAYVDLPEIRKVSAEDVEVNYLRMKKEVRVLVKLELEKLLSAESPAKSKVQHGKTIEEKRKNLQHKSAQSM